MVGLHLPLGLCDGIGERKKGESRDFGVGASSFRVRRLASMVSRLQPRLIYVSTAIATVPDGVCRKLLRRKNASDTQTSTAPTTIERTSTINSVVEHPTVEKLKFTEKNKKRKTDFVT